MGAEGPHLSPQTTPPEVKWPPIFRVMAMFDVSPLAEIKAVSSCIRNTDLLAKIAQSKRLNRNREPQEGDVVLTRVLSDSGAWDFIESTTGRETRIYSDDLILSILGTRRSGTSPSGMLPASQVKRGEVLSLVSASGLVAIADSTPRFYREPRKVQVEAFFGVADRVINLRDCIRPATETGSPQFGVVIVAGTAAEVGKTTALTRLMREFRQLSPRLQIGAIKACGTGRLRDCLAYRDTGANRVVDFVDFGWPSTYNIPSQSYRCLMKQMLAVLRQVDIVFVEIGGDLLEGRAPEALGELSGLRALPVLCVSDAMGATTGLGILEKHGWKDVPVASHRQNLKCLQERLAGAQTLDTANGQELAKLASSLLDKLR